MSHQSQIFESKSKWRRYTVSWAGRFFIVFATLLIPFIFLAVHYLKKPELPLLASEVGKQQNLAQQVIPLAFKPAEKRKYKGFNQYLHQQVQKTLQSKSNTHHVTNRIRAAFYVDWDPQSFYSLQSNIGKLNMVLPEWFFIDEQTCRLRTKIDTSALNLMKQYPVKIVPIINNTNQTGDGNFNGKLLHAILHSKEKKERLIADIVSTLQQYKLQGINIDFEDLQESSDEPLMLFQQELYNALKPKGLLVTQDIEPSNTDYNIEALNAYNDYIFLMAYDQHWPESIPGPVSEQKWIEKVLDETAAKIPSDKIILGLACYGYDWQKNKAATTLTYQQTLATAKEYEAQIQFDNDTYNCHYHYTDGDQQQHDVYFTDAISNFNTIRFADEYGTAGTAIWRLGSEDRRIWTYYNHDLSNDSIAQHPLNIAKLETVHEVTSRPDYVSDGEILNVLSSPVEGHIQVSLDTTEQIVTEETYQQLPTNYVIKKYGNVHNQVVLTFDDGPDPDYTPRILDILKKEKVPAAFFVVGMNAEENLPLLQRIYKEGHEIGNHTFTHPNIAQVSEERALREMDATLLVIEAASGHGTILFRAPYNADSEPTQYEELKPVALSRNNHYYTVGESIDPNDWDKGVTADSIYDRIVKQYEANPEKGIILLHDAGGNREATVQALPRIIAYFKNKGVGFTTISALLHKQRDQIMEPVAGKLTTLDSDVADSLYWVKVFFTSAFWLAIVLGLVRISAMGIMAYIQNQRSKKEKATLPASIPLPAVSVIVPAYNEELNAVGTVKNLLEQDYPDLHIIFVNDGSKDNTYEKVNAAFENHSQVTVLTKPNGGKASALNFGIAHANTDFVVCIDSDTQLKPDAIRLLMQTFFLPADGKEIAAVAGNVKVGNERNLLTKWQSIEYCTAQNFDRKAFDLVNGITVVPGAIGAFKTKAIQQVGGFTTDTLAEDCDLTIRLLKAGYRIRNCNEAVAVTEAPETIRQFMKQRFRWSYGVMQCFWKHKEACFNPRYKGLGLLSLPNILIFQIILPILAPFADLVLLLSLIFSWNNPENLGKIGLVYGIFLLVDVLISLFAFSFENEKPGKLIWLIPQRFAYRQIMYVVLYRSIKKAIIGETQGWGTLKRTGNAQLKMAKTTA